MLTLATELKDIKGVGPERARILETKRIVTVEDLLYYIPRRYEDRTHPRTLRQVQPGETATVVAAVRGAWGRIGAPTSATLLAPAAQPGYLERRTPCAARSPGVPWLLSRTCRTNYHEGFGRGIGWA